MDRLTKTSDKGGLAFTFDLDITCAPSEMRKIVALGERLKAYEDTGLTPEEIIELRVHQPGYCSGCAVTENDCIVDKNFGLEEENAQLREALKGAEHISVSAGQTIKELKEQLAEQERNYRLGVNAGADAIKQLRAELARMSKEKNTTLKCGGCNGRESVKRGLLYQCRFCSRNYPDKHDLCRKPEEGEKE